MHRRRNNPDSERRAARQRRGQLAPLPREELERRLRNPHLGELDRRVIMGILGIRYGHPVVPEDQKEARRLL